MLGDPTAAFRRLERYRRVTAGEIRTAARRYFVENARTIVKVLPDPDAPEEDEDDDTEEEAAQ